MTQEEISTELALEFSRKHIADLEVIIADLKSADNPEGSAAYQLGLKDGHAQGKEAMKKMVHGAILCYAEAAIVSGVGDGIVQAILKLVDGLK